MSEFNNTTDKNVENWDTLKDRNPWKEIFNKNSQELLKRILEGKEGEFIYLEDKTIIEDRNKVLAKNNKKKDNVFITSLLPKPYRGNLKDPKLVILSLNPSYKKRVKTKMFEMLREEHQLRFIEIAKKNALLEDGCRIIPDVDKDDKNYWIDVVTDDGYWLDKLSELIGEPDVDISKIGLIQFIPYASSHFESWANEAKLKSQEFSMKIIHRLLKDESTLFLVMRAKKQWEALFRKYKVEVDKDEIGRRFIYNKNPICQKITRDNLMNMDASNPDQYQTILNAFNNNQ
ncbi:MAG: hypothetical protein K6E93_05270 [Bacteroidales bacterium]|nr:hypothetical protein [Bacteroidales bacterium]